MAFDTIDDSIINHGREYGFHWGIVTTNVDPEKLGRVKIYVPGITNVDTAWAFPCGTPGTGYKQLGGYSIPRIGATVIVGFIQGDLDEPFYFSGPCPTKEDGTSGIPRRPAMESPEEAPNVRVLAQTENFEVYIRDTNEMKELCMRGLDDDASFMTIDLNDGSIHLSAKRYFAIEAPMVSIRASGQLQLNDRVVGAIGSKI